MSLLEPMVTLLLGVLAIMVTIGSTDRRTRNVIDSELKMVAALPVGSEQRARLEQRVEGRVAAYLDRLDRRDTQAGAKRWQLADRLMAAGFGLGVSAIVLLEFVSPNVKPTQLFEAASVVAAAAGAILGIASARLRFERRPIDGGAP